MRITVNELEQVVANENNKLNELVFKQNKIRVRSNKVSEISVRITGRQRT